MFAVLELGRWSEVESEGEERGKWFEYYIEIDDMIWFLGMLRVKRVKNMAWVWVWGFYSELDYLGLLLWKIVRVE